ncbi:MAG TPA: VOC family protein [Nocardioidaceae bacterium]|nr:VOC family protein [Nocardioidaceae bacterium]
MTTRSLPLDHLVYAVPDLAAAVTDFEDRLGVRAAPGGRHEGLGTHNALLGLGPTSYLELIAPDPDQPEPAGPRPFGVDEAVTSPKLVAWALTCTDIDVAIGQARAHGYDPGDAVPLQRRTADGRTLHWRLTVNALNGGPVPFLIDWGDTEHPARSAPQGLSLESFHVTHPAPESLTPVLEALGAAVTVRQATEPGMVALVAGPRGAVTLA